MEIRKDIVTWLKNWFYTEGEVDTLLGAKVNVNQGQASMNVVTGTDGKVTLEAKPTIPDVSTKADKTGGASQITDTNAAGYTNISNNLTSSSTVADILSAVNTKFGNINLDVIIVTQDKGTATAAKMNKLYVEVGTTTDVYFVEAHTSGSTTTYEWVKLEDIIFDDLSIDWSDVENNPFDSYSPSDFAADDHDHGSILNDGTLTSSASSIKNVVVTDNSDNVKVTSASGLFTGSFTELQGLITAASAGDTILLNKDYKNTGSESAISISKNLTIIGNSHVLDADEKSRIFTLDGGTSSANVTVNITGLYFVNGKITGSDDDGGAIYAPTNHIINVSDCSFNNNSSAHDGGAIRCNTSNTLSNCVFNNNNASRDGAAIKCGSSNTITDCSFNNNNSSRQAGAIYCGPTNNITDCIFKNNTTTGDGNDIYANSTTTIYNCDTSSANLYKVTNRLYLTDEIDLVETGTYAGYIVFHTR